MAMKNVVKFITISESYIKEEIGNVFITISALQSDVVVPTMLVSQIHTSYVLVVIHVLLDMGI